MVFNQWGLPTQREILGFQGEIGTTDWQTQTVSFRVPQRTTKRSLNRLTLLKGHAGFFLRLHLCFFATFCILLISHSH